MTDPAHEPAHDPKAAAAERANTFPWPPVLLALAITGAILFQKLFPIGWPGQDDPVARTVGLTIGLAGLVLIAAAIVSLRRHDTTVMPHQKSDHLVTSGPYRIFRNPIYLGEVMALFGIAELTKNIWFVVLGGAFAVLVTWLQIVSEERHLEARFGDAYRDYKNRARRWI